MSPKTRIGRVQRGIRRAFIVRPGVWSTRELLEWTHARRLYQGKRSHRERHNYCRAVRRAADQLALHRFGTEESPSEVPKRSGTLHRDFGPPLMGGSTQQPLVLSLSEPHPSLPTGVSNLPS